MCERCDGKMLALDSQVPHFIDWVNGGPGARGADAVKARVAFKEYQQFRKGVHGL